MILETTYRWYDEPDGWIEWIEKDGIIYGSAHATGNKYSRAMLRELKKGINLIIRKKAVLITELRYNYLIKFYSRHWKIIKLQEHFYKIEEGKGLWAEQ